MAIEGVVSKKSVKIGVTYSFLAARILSIYREVNDIDGVEFAKVISVNQSSYSRMERGHTKISLEDYHALAHRLGLTMSMVDETIDSLLNESKYVLLSREQVLSSEGKVDVWIRPWIKDEDVRKQRALLRAVDFDLKCRIYKRLGI